MMMEIILFNPAVSAINFYQRFLSPYKGFSCAHRIIRGGLSCSEFAKRRIQEKGLFMSLADIRGRLRDCRMTYLKAMEERKQEKAEQANNKNNDCDPGCDILELGSCDFLPGLSGKLTSSMVDIGSCDGISAPDIGGCDGGCDIGGC